MVRSVGCLSVEGGLRIGHGEVGNDGVTQGLNNREDEVADLAYPNADGPIRAVRLSASEHVHEPVERRQRARSG